MTERHTVFMHWLPLAVAITLLSALSYGIGQQVYRQSLNDPQIQLAEDAARVVAAGVDPKALAPSGSAVEISASLATWIAFYDADHAPQASTGLLHGVVPTIPDGVFEAAKTAGENRITWEPEPGVRQAVVVVPAGDRGFAVSGRGMGAAEERIAALGSMVLIGWAITLLASFLAISYTRRRLQLD